MKQPICASTEANALIDCIDKPISTVIIVLGIAGNIYSVVLLFHMRLHSSMLISLLILSVWDIVLLAASFLHYSLASNVHLWRISPDHEGIHAVSLNGFVAFAHLMSTWMLIEVFAKRFVAVSRPLKLLGQPRIACFKRRRQSYLRMAAFEFKYPIMTVIFAAVVTLPTSFEYTVVHCTRDGQHSYEIVATDLLRRPAYRLLYRTLLMTFLKTFGPFVIISALAIATLNEYRRSLRRRAAIILVQDEIHASDRDKTRSLQMVSSVLLVKFVLLRCFPTFLEIWQYRGLEMTPAFEPLPSSLTHNEVPTSSSVTLLARLAYLLVLLNSATNSLVIVILKSFLDSVRRKRAQMRQRISVAQHVDQVLLLGHAFIASNLGEDGPSQMKNGTI
ncbi:hypothetical protein Tcan_03474 [Toxocara canis]|uniref:G-protein coupled receptors family 1 profile domain-containing protein n=1 Tax=Toxocara canis TaxID=6265 RepID=A0A0B2VJK3_TOXCA|nr:hypothetical protein Tcan_03474 [Toxocara canis]